MHIAIEGFDGVGKSTAAKKLAEKLGFLLVEKPLHFLFDEEGDKQYIRIRNTVNQSKNKQFTGWFYGLGNIYMRNLGDKILLPTDIFSPITVGAVLPKQIIFSMLFSRRQVLLILLF